MIPRDPVARLIARWNKDGVHVHLSQDSWGDHWRVVSHYTTAFCRQPELGHCVRVRLTKMVPAPEEEAQPLSEEPIDEVV